MIASYFNHRLLIVLYLLFLNSKIFANLPLHPIQSVQELKTTALVIYADHLHTFFCEKTFMPNGVILEKHCPDCPFYETKIKWLSIVTPENFAKDLPCSREKLCLNQNGKLFKGKKCCEKNSSIYQMMNQDLFNLVPESPALVKLRGQHQFKPFLGGTEACSLELDAKNHIFYVPAERMGFIARTMLYMADTYSLPMTEDCRKQLLEWHQTYPPSSWEILRNKKIKAIQGNENLWITLWEPHEPKNRKSYQPHLVPDGQRAH